MTTGIACERTRVSILIVIIYSWTSHFFCSVVRGVEDVALVEPSLLMVVKCLYESLIVKLIIVFVPVFRRVA